MHSWSSTGLHSPTRPAQQYCALHTPHACWWVLKPMKPRSTRKIHDRNLQKPQLLINRPCIYERHLPGNSYVSASVSRLQHGHYSSAELSDGDFDAVDFVALDFVFQAPQTPSHRFKSAVIRVSVRGARVDGRAGDADGAAASPRILKHAPHLIVGAVSPEHMEWTFSLGGTVGTSHSVVDASVNPENTMKDQYVRYQMMHIQASVRTLRPSTGGSAAAAAAATTAEVEDGQVVWSIEENSVQQSGLPREFTFVMLVHKPHALSDVVLSVEVEPAVQNWIMSYPRWWLSQRQYQPVRRQRVDFRKEVGQRFESLSAAGSEKGPMAGKGFNFADLDTSFENFVRMPGSTFTAYDDEKVRFRGMPLVLPLVVPLVVPLVLLPANFSSLTSKCRHAAQPTATIRDVRL